LDRGTWATQGFFSGGNKGFFQELVERIFSGETNSGGISFYQLPELREKHFSTEKLMYPRTKTIPRRYKMLRKPISSRWSLKRAQ